MVIPSWKISRTNGGVVMNGFLLVVPIVLIRFGVLGHAGKRAMERAAFFPPTEGLEKTAFWVYQLSVTAMLVYPLTLKAALEYTEERAGAGIYLFGLVVYALSSINFSKPGSGELNTNGLYKFSRNPMYVAFFLLFLGVSLLTHSWLLFGVLVLHQISVHFLILSEERWCSKQFGGKYQAYRASVRRYL